MKRSVLIGVWLSFVSSIGYAQPLHNYPGKAAYASAAEWPIVSFQGHYPGPDPITSQHVHVEPKFPLYAELGSGTFDVPFTIVTHHLAGRVGMFFGENIAKVKWDETGTDQMPVMRGDPVGDKSWTGIATIDPKLGGVRAAPAKGWQMVRFGTRTAFDSGAQIDVSGWASYFSVIDPNAEERPSQPTPSRGIVSTRVDLVSPVSGTSIGTMVMEYQDYLPLLPINAPWLTLVSGYNYTGTAETSGALEQRHNIDFHHGVPGNVDALTLAGRAGVNRSILFDPAAMGGAGPHRDAIIWRQVLGSESVWALVVYVVSVGDTVPPLPKLCTDPKATNVGQPLPCVYPTPPAVTPFTPFFGVNAVGALVYCKNAALTDSCKEFVVK